MNYLDDPNVSSADKVFAVYIGLLGRVAEFIGFDYWRPEIQSGVTTPAQMSQNIVDNQYEYSELVAGKDREARIYMIYDNLFGREPDQAGLDYWLNSSIPDDGLAVALINGASSTDRQVLDGRINFGHHSYANRMTGPTLIDIVSWLALHRSYTKSVTATNAGSVNSAWNNNVADEYYPYLGGPQYDTYFG